MHNTLIKKQSILIMLIFCSSLSACAPVSIKHDKDDWFSPDKAKHFVVAAAIGAGTTMMLKRTGSDHCDAAAGGVSMVLVLGSAKEYHDKYNRKKSWSWKDMFWNVIGGTAGSLMAADCH